MQLSTYLCPPTLPTRAANEGGPVRDVAPIGASPVCAPWRRPHPSAAIVPLPQARRSRQARPEERRGEILLFLGVRYERRAC